MQPHGRDSRRGPWLRCFLPGGFSGRNLIPSGKKFAWLALGQQLSPSRLPWLAPSRKTLPGPGLLHSHLDVVIRCSWSLDFCQGNGVADLAGRIKILHLDVSTGPWTTGQNDAVSLGRSAGCWPERGGSRRAEGADYEEREVGEKEEEEERCPRT